MLKKAVKRSLRRSNWESKQVALFGASSALFGVFEQVLSSALLRPGLIDKFFGAAAAHLLSCAHDGAVAEAYDVDGGGTIDLEEFIDLLEACQPELFEAWYVGTPEERHRTLEVLSSNGDAVACCSASAFTASTSVHKGYKG